MLTGFSYHPGFLDAVEAETLLAAIRVLPFRTDTVRGKTMRRTIVCYGNDYSVARRSARNPAPPVPEFLRTVRDRAAALANVDAATLEQAILWKYPSRVGINWHVDHRDYGAVICGVSLGSAATMRMRNGAEEVRQQLDPNSLYILRDEARYAWFHKVDGNRDERYSITFRSMAKRS